MTGTLFYALDKNLAINNKEIKSQKNVTKKERIK